MSAGFDTFLDALKNDEFEERPVDLETFLYSEDFLNFPPLSPIQIKCIEAMTQVYRKDTLVKLWGRDEAERLWASTQQEILLYLGKGSGKDAMTAIAFARIAYLLLCLKDPAKYYGKPPGDSIAMLNIAINAQQAKNVFFRYFKTRIKACEWFDDKIVAETADSFTFEKNVSAFSGHSEREAWEGYNFIIVTLDEIAGFAVDEEATAEGGARAKTADAIYDMYKASVISRFPKMGKLVMLSFSRYKGDFISKRYDKVVAEKHTVVKTHTFKVRENLPDGVEGNEITIEWEEDEIISYTEEGVYAIRRPTWYVNPTIEIDDFKQAFLNKTEDALTRFACMPSDAVDAFFKDHEAIARAFPVEVPGPFTEGWVWRENFKPATDRNYYVHIDLAYKHDRAAVAMASVVDWVTVKYGEAEGAPKHVQPIISVDAVRYWTPTAEQNIDLEDIKNFVVSLKRAGFKIKLATFDQWNSVGYRQQLQQDFRIETDRVAVAKPHYEDFSFALHENRIRGYDIPLLRDELKGLKIIKGNKVDHTRKGSKDVSDAVVGAVYNAINNEKTPGLPEIEIFFGTPSEDKASEPEEEPEKPKPKMPKELEQYMKRWKVI